MKRGHRAFISVSLGSALHFSPAPSPPHSCSRFLLLLRWLALCGQMEKSEKWEKGKSVATGPR
ncbi:GM19511 [Drosophila sechellia]|uniref:GM19511 n=1 Tax=Drosophila sechellia TaxID=7238 RepID=B4I6B6_DROSE|nr:GM19511 [Drosophila sechellia]